jgi:hypothetical protein
VAEGGGDRREEGRGGKEKRKRQERATQPSEETHEKVHHGTRKPHTFEMMGIPLGEKEK